MVAAVVAETIGTTAALIDRSNVPPVAIAYIMNVNIYDLYGCNRLKFAYSRCNDCTLTPQSTFLPCVFRLLKNFGYYSASINRSIFVY